MTGFLRSSQQPTVEWNTSFIHFSATCSSYPEPVKLISGNSGMPTSSIKKSNFLRSAGNVLSEMDGKQVRKLLYSSLSVHLCAKRHLGNEEFFSTLVYSISVAAAAMNCRRYLYLVQKTNRRLLSLFPQEHVNPKLFEVLEFCGE